MKLEKAGFFRELRHGDTQGPSLASARDIIPLADRSRLARYLSGATVLAVTGVTADDWFNRERKAIATVDLRTDGVWVWPGDLSYYVAEYGVELPAEFLIHIARMKYTPVELDARALQSAEEAFFS